MCGIAGVLDFGGGTRDALLDAARSMAGALRHRGPDDAGVWADRQSGIALGHSRLAVIDVSHSGRQPMQSSCGRYVTTFNGEIYNFVDLRKNLESRGHQFRSSSDTEVLLASVAEWGIEQAVSRFVGMFAFAVWDRRERKLHLCRDRVGEKPLYYGQLGRAFVFASELGAFHEYSSELGELDRNALHLYLRHGYVPAPYSIYSKIRKLPPASILTVASEGSVSEPVPYWCARAVAAAGLGDPVRCTSEEAVEQLDKVLRGAVRLQTRADVPVGAFLSGGIDSAAVVAMMCGHGTSVRTFTIGFTEAGYDESAHARAVAQHLGTAHTELRVTPSEAMEVIPRLPEIYTEPFADASQVPTFLVSQLARRDVTVSLSGDGGDELFGGYNRYFWADSVWRSIRCVPGAMRNGLARALRGLAPGYVDSALAAMAPVLPSRARVRHPGDKLHKVAGLLGARDAGDLYLRLVSQWMNPEDVVRGGLELATALRGSEQPALPDLKHHMMLLDTLTYLPDDILAKLDRASMSNGLEARAPFLDHRVIEFAWRLPLRLKVRNAEGKHILRKVLHRYVPPDLVDRPKAGFSIPLDVWLRGPMRDWAEELLSENGLRSGGYFRPGPVRARWQEHLSGKRNWVGPLWAVLMFQAWHARQRKTRPSEVAHDVRIAAAI
jgi:asparagine synthase (glutamine-hydrolysing)